MSSYNHEEYIAESIESVLNQSFGDLELIITDDCSTDASREIIDKYKHTDNRINAVFHSSNLGITRTMNDCLDQVRGKYVCFLDSDDLWVANKLERQLEVLKRDDTKLLWSDGKIIDYVGQNTGKPFTRFLNTPPSRSGSLFEQLLCEQFVPLQTLIFRSDYLRSVRFNSELKYTNDHRFLVDLAADHEFLFMPEYLAKYRIHGSNTTFRNEHEWAKDKIKVRKYFLDAYSDRLSVKARADIYYQIGFYLSRLGCKAEAKKYYLQALKIDHIHFNSVLYTVLALTMGEGLGGQLLLNSYNLSTDLLMLLKSDV